VLGGSGFHSPQNNHSNHCPLLYRFNQSIIGGGGDLLTIFEGSNQSCYWTVVGDDDLDQILIFNSADLLQISNSHSWPTAANSRFDGCRWR
jgi:hypothetical protein